MFNEWLAATIGTFLGWAYFAGMESSERQATLGKSAMGIYVTDLNGQRITFLRATGRYFAKILSGLLLGFRLHHGSLHGPQAGAARYSRQHPGIKRG